MPRTLHSAGIRAWRYEQLINDLALGEQPHSELAERYNVEVQTVRVFAMNHRADVEARKADWANQYGHIWSTKVENRLRVLTCRLEEIEDQLALLRDHARAETEMIRNVDPEAAEVLVNDRVYLKYVAEQRSLLREIADQTGQLPTRLAVDPTSTRGSLTDWDTIALDANGQWHAVR
jgi:hypothetical protein